MKLEEALKWADTFGSIQGNSPTGDGPALVALAAAVRRLATALERIRSFGQLADSPKPFDMESAAQLEANLAECLKIATGALAEATEVKL